MREDPYIKGIAEGNNHVIREIYEKYHLAILKLVEQHGGNREDARDVFQEGLMLVYQKLQQPDFELSSSFFTYFFAVCRNIWWNKRKKKSNNTLTLNEDAKLIAGDLNANDVEANEQYLLYRKKYLELGKDCRELLRLFLQKVKMQEIMERMKYNSVNYVKQKKFKCKRQLIKLIEQDPAYHELIN